MPILNSLTSSRLEGSRAAFLGYRPFINAVNVTAETVNEGQSVTYTVTTVNVPNNTVINWQVTGISINDLSSGSLSGTLTILNNVATTSITLSFAGDLLLEGDEFPLLTLTMAGRAPFSKQITLADFSRPTFEIDFQPEDKSALFYANTPLLFTTTATAINNGPNNYSYTWQTSNNNGTSWSNLSSSSFDLPAGGVNQPGTLGVKPWVIDMQSYNNTLFRCVVRDAINNYSLTTRAATLTVTAPPYGAAVLTNLNQNGFDVQRIWTVPANVYAISTVLVAAGGGGAGNYANPNYWEGRAGGGGGGGGTIASGLLKVVPGESLILVAGAAGTPGATSTGGQNGRDTTLTFYVAANGAALGTLKAIGGGGGGMNAYSSSIMPNTLQVRYGARGARGTTAIDSYVTEQRTITNHLRAFGGSGGLGAIGVRTNGFYLSSSSRAGGGAAGYGGSGGDGSDSSSNGNGLAGSEGGGGGGAGCGVANGATSYVTVDNGGGGVGLLGIGSSGLGGIGGSSRSGKGGSGGNNATESDGGGLYGGGGQGGEGVGRRGGGGALRIIFGLGTNSSSLRSYAANIDTANTSNTTIL